MCGRERKERELFRKCLGDETCVLKRTSLRRFPAMEAVCELSESNYGLSACPVLPNVSDFELFVSTASVI